MHGFGCNCCPPDEAKIACTDAAFLEENVSRLFDSVLLAGRAKAEDTPGGESGGEEFLEEELFLAALLAGFIFKRGKLHKKPLLNHLLQENPDISKLYDLLAEFDGQMGAAIPDETVDEIRQSLARAMNTGAMNIPSGAISNTPSGTVGYNTVMEGYPTVNVTHESLFATVAYAATNYGRRFIVGPAMEMIERIRDNTPTLQQPNLSPVSVLVDQRLRNTPYWDVVANSAASRSYHYGYVKTATIQGLQGYRFVAVVDGRTTQICRAMNGREFRLNDALNHMEYAYSLPTIEAQMEASPWFTDADAANIGNLTPADFTESGLLIPPLHARCRSTIVAF